MSKKNERNGQCGRKIARTDTGLKVQRGSEKNLDVKLYVDERSKKMKTEVYWLQWHKDQHQ